MMVKRNRLAELVAETGITLPQLADAIAAADPEAAITNKQLSRIILGRRGASLATATALEKVFTEIDARTGERKAKITAREIREIPRLPRQGPVSGPVQAPARTPEASSVG